MKAALAIWGSKGNEFQQGFAKETDDPAIIKATMEHPGIVLRRPVGTDGAFKEHAELPKLSALQKALKEKQPPPTVTKTPKKELRQPDTAASRKAAELYDLAQQRREREEQRDRARREKEKVRRAQAVEKAKAALDAALENHEKRNADIANERERLDRRARFEDERWKEEKNRLEAALKRARD
ncbi:MAG TPA: cell envelope biogenesis protein TolA [Rhizomicrobium sp.]|nr:cell envelope biogenesis protein TolA [Rhizomicrobium sp.]